MNIKLNDLKIKTNNEFYMSLMYESIMNSKSLLIKNITIDKIMRIRRIHCRSHYIKR